MNSLLSLASLLLIYRSFIGFIRIRRKKMRAKPWAALSLSLVCCSMHTASIVEETSRLDHGRRSIRDEKGQVRKSSIQMIMYSSTRWCNSSKFDSWVAAAVATRHRLQLDTFDWRQRRHRSFRYVNKQFACSFFVLINSEVPRHRWRSERHGWGRIFAWIVLLFTNLKVSCYERQDCMNISSFESEREKEQYFRDLN